MNNPLFRLSVYLLVSLFATTALFSQPLFFENGTPSHPNVLGYSSPTRSIIDLAGEWNYSTDNGESWNPVMIPAAADYEGKIVYRKNFTVQEQSVVQRSFTFVSYGINHRADVYVNETFVGKHEGGYTSFELAIPDNVIQVGSENVIRIVADNSLNYRTTFPPRPQVNGKKNYNGLIRDLFIVETPKIWIDKVSVEIEAIEPKAVKLLITATISANEFQNFPQLSGNEFILTADIAEHTGGSAASKPVSVRVTPLPNKDVTAQVSVTVAFPKLWSPESPELYAVRAALGVVDGKKDSTIDETSVLTGIRTFTKDKSVLLLNGAPVTLRGLVWIEDSERFGSAMTYEEMERDIALIKNLGANVMRIGFHPPHPFIIQLCDRYGIMVMEEIPNVDIPEQIVEDEQYGMRMINYLKAMIERDKYNPSVIAWGLGDGSGYSADKENNIVSRLHLAAKSLDDRLTYYIERGANEKTSGVPDIAAISFSAVDAKTFSARLKAFRQVFSKKPVIIAGYGIPAEKDNRNGYSDPNSQESQARYIQQRYSIIKDLKLAGSLIYSFNDFRSDRPILRMRPVAPGLHTIGLVELGRQKKVGYDIVHSVYHAQKVSALPIGTYVPSAPYVYVIIGMILLVAAAWLVNGNRRFRESTRRSIFNSYNFFADIRDQFTLPLFHTTITAVIISITVSVISSSVLYHYRTSLALDYMLSELFSDYVKSIIIRMCWDPLLSVGYMTGLVIVWFLILTVLIQLFAVIARVKIRLFHAYSIAVWTALPWVFFIPVGMILYRVLESDPYVPWVLGLIVLMSVWVYIRTLKGISVIYHVFTPKMYLIGFGIWLISVGALYTFFDYAYALTAYAEFFASRILPFIQ